MVVKAIYHGLSQIHRIYHAGKLIFQRDPVVFHVIEDGKLIILGALSAVPLEDGLYLDCAPEWVEPEEVDGILYLRQAYSITQQGIILEVR